MEFFRFLNNHFGIEFRGLVYNDLVKRSLDQPEPLVSKNSELDKSESEESENDVLEATSLENTVLQAIHVSEISLWKLKQENPKDSRFADEDEPIDGKDEGLDKAKSISKDNSAGTCSPRSRASKLKRPTSFGKKNSSSSGVTEVAFSF
ncbi:uncharacterized protein [Watersipora subatra]|uniref:uncharacterized protein n=1 Tax=Watersipora subatra TaxID=2589382 RepID=UPI00355B52E1